MARVLKFRYRRRRQVRSQTIALTMALVFATTLTILRQPGLAEPLETVAPASVSERWARAAADPPELVTIDDSAFPAELPGPSFETATSGVAVHRGAAGGAAALRFTLCHSGGGGNCVVDGDTFWLRGEKIRIADIDTPETHPPRCAAEAAKGAAATRRLQALLNAGPFDLAAIDRDTDRYGRKLRIVTRDGASIGGTLVDEGLARWYGGGRQAWC